MTTINGDSQVSRSNALQCDVANITKKVLDPLDLFGGDKFGSKGASGLFPNGGGGGGSIEDRLAELSKKDKNSSFDTSDADAGLFSGGKDMGQGSGGMGQMGQQIGQMLGGLLKQVLPLLLAFI